MQTLKGGIDMNLHLWKDITHVVKWKRNQGIEHYHTVTTLAWNYIDMCIHKHLCIEKDIKGICENVLYKCDLEKN